MFIYRQVFPGITHLQDNMGVCFTLLEGKERALLIDAGYGLEDVSAQVKAITDKPVSLVLTHGHHDHVLGARWFSRAYLCREDLAEYELRTGREQREKVAGQAGDNGLTVPDDFLTAWMPEPEEPEWNQSVSGFSARKEDLGGMEILIIRVPGHTEGSLTIYVPDFSLLLTGDDWNPCTWMWFPCSLPVQEWHTNMTKLLDSLERKQGIKKVLCSHQPMLREGTELLDYLSWITPSVLEKAEKSGISNEIRVHRAFLPERGWELLFDADKAGFPG